MEYKVKIRLVCLTLVFAVLLGLYSYRLFDLQVLHPAKRDNNINTFTYYTRVTAARGEILDRNGNVLVGNRASYNLILNNYALFNSDDPNESLRQLVDLCRKRGVEYTDHLPVTHTKPYEYTTEEFSSTWNSYFREFLSQYGWDSDISAAQLIKLMRQRFRIPDDWAEQEVRDVLGLRYELDLRYYAALDYYTLISDVDDEDRSAIMELGVPGLTVETGTVREYRTQYAAHILGRIGLMNPEEYEVFKDQGYAMDAYVGKDGLEKAFESELHGTDGRRVTTVDEGGNIVSQYYSVQPEAGSNIELSIDIDLQLAAEEALEKLILDLRENGINAKGEGKDAKGGACVVMDVNTGEILACASYPTFNIATYSDDFDDLLEDPYAPLYNRALQATYPPGSTFKMATTIAAIDSGTISKYYAVEDKGIYTYYDDYQPKCLYYTNTNGKYTHGIITVMQALAVSCNYYFYEVGRMTGWRNIDAVAKSLGLGEDSGCELYEETGYRANPETKEMLYGGTDLAVFTGGDTIAMAIGQSENRFTPLQLAVYTSALANRGTRYKATFLKRVISADYETLVKENKPVVLDQLDISDDAYSAYTEGMRMAVTSTSGTAHNVFGDYDIAVCAKTGTAEHGSAGSDNASYVCFAPANDPKIAVVIYVERGAQGGNLGNVAKSVFDVYFSTESRNDTVVAENVVH